MKSVAVSGLSPRMSHFQLGFLLCDHALDHLADHLADQFGDYPAMFERAFGEVCAPIEWRTYDVTLGQVPAQVGECDGYLISGSRHGAYDQLDWIAPLEDFIRQIASSPQPLVGLCFGHQLIAQALGGSVEKAAQGWGIGIFEYRVRQTQAWMTPGLTSFSVPVCHQDQVINLPPHAELLASSAHCENFFVQFAPNIVGLQGHPEFEPEFVAQLLAWRQTILSAELHATASRSLQHTHDNASLKRWLATFLGLPLKAL